MALKHFVIFSILVAAAFAKVAKILPCANESSEQCQVTEARITPCQGSSSCAFKKGLNVSLSFDFTPNFAASQLNSMVYWAAAPGDAPFADMDSNTGCSLTTCPTVPGTSQVLNYNLYIGKKLPTGPYQIKWKVWNSENDKEMCCFLTSIKLLKTKKNK